MSLHQMSQTMTTAEIVRHFRERGELVMLLSQLDTLPRGEAIAIEQCLSYKAKDDGLVCFDKDENQDIANEMCGV